MHYDKCFSNTKAIQGVPKIRDQVLRVNGDEILR